MSPRTQDERAAVLEERFDHLEKRFEKVEGKVDEIHNVLLQAKGARWAVLGVAGLIGFAGAKLGAWFPFIGSGLPK
jgi:hypothetical protein